MLPFFDRRRASNMENIFAQFEAWLVAFSLAVTLLVAWGLGWWFGQRVRKREGESRASKFDDASLALLGLLLAFTFSTSIGKHDYRRLMVVADANAIGDFYTCASLLKEPVRTKLQNVIRDYTTLRLKVARQSFDGSAFEDALRQFQSMQGQMANLVSEALAEGTPIAGSLTNTLNAVASNHVVRLAGIRDRLPSSVVFLLFAAAIITTMLVGREQGASGKADIIGTLCFILLVAIAVYVTLDLNQPERGLIRISQEPIERLLSSMSR
jgi:fucose 4-O-acetylase-like acetyltransferase